jgi:hypothetical protein
MQARICICELKVNAIMFLFTDSNQSEVDVVISVFFFVTRVTQWVTRVEQEQPMIPDYLSLSPCFSGVRAAQSLVFSVERKKKNTEITTSTSD